MVNRSQRSVTAFGTTTTIDQHRKARRTDLGMTYDDVVLAAVPTNLAARSYKGQGHAARGNISTLAAGETTRLQDFTRGHS